MGALRLRRGAACRSGSAYGALVLAAPARHRPPDVSEWPRGANRARRIGAGGSRMAGIPHASVCGGRGRCSTCRIKVDGAKEAMLPPAAEEVKVLHRVGAAPDVR